MFYCVIIWVKKLLMKYKAANFLKVCQLPLIVIHSLSIKHGIKCVKNFCTTNVIFLFKVEILCVMGSRTWDDYC